MSSQKAARVWALMLIFGVSLCSAASEESKGSIPSTTGDHAIQGLIDQSLAALKEGILPIESLQAEDLYAENESLLTDPTVIKALEKQANLRKKIDDEPATDDDYARQAMQSFKDSLRLTPSVMTLEELQYRARVMAHIARAQSKVNPHLCRSLPHDFSFLLDVEPSWLIGMPADTVRKAASDEGVAVKRILDGMMLIDVNVTSKQTTFASFAGEWLSGLNEQTRYEIGRGRAHGNYCPLWSKLLDDLARMTAAFPVTGHKLLRPMMLNSPRGWFDQGQWAPLGQDYVE